MAHGRPPKGEDHYQRGSSQRQPRRRVLIVSEGQTELAYLHELLDYLDLNRANVKMRQGQPSNPDGVLGDARQHFEADPEEYSRIFCVFDRDEHQSFAPVLQEIQTGIRRGEIISAVPSVPCFEYWLLLHPCHQACAKPMALSCFAKYGDAPELGRILGLGPDGNSPHHPLGHCRRHCGQNHFLSSLNIENKGTISESQNRPNGS